MFEVFGGELTVEQFLQSFIIPYVDFVLVSNFFINSLKDKIESNRMRPNQDLSIYLNQWEEQLW